MNGECKRLLSVKSMSVSALVLLVIFHGATAAVAHTRMGLVSSPPLLPCARHHVVPRGGGGTSTVAETEVPMKKKKKRKSRKRTTRTSVASTKQDLSQAMKEKDAATALGDAIRDRANMLRSDMNLSRIDDSVSSVGWAMGASDYSSSKQGEQDGGGVEAAPTSVLANYFLQSHGGAHALQCACSFLATLTAMGAIVLSPSKHQRLKLTCLKRSLQFAMSKHVSGLLAASTMAASAIPRVGLRQARVWMEKLSVDPVSQYLFYAALLQLWMPDTTLIGDNTWWWQTPVGTYSPLLMVGPILLREAVSTALVVSDVLVLLTTSRTDEENGGNVPVVLQLGQSLVSVVMSLLVTPSVWRNSNAATRQEILAKGTTRLCLVMELAVGVLLGMDGLLALWEQSFASSNSRPAILGVLKRLVCARLYLNYLWVKRRKVVKLASDVRGGASQFPLRVLDAILDPRASMGLPPRDNQPQLDGKIHHDFKTLDSWKDYARIALGFEE